MFKKALFIVSLSTVLNAFICQYDVRMEFKRGKTPDTNQNTFMINGNKVKCKCGNNPSFILFCYGSPEAFCYKHLPIREVPEMSLEEALTMAEGHENGCYQTKN